MKLIRAAIFFGLMCLCEPNTLRAQALFNGLPPTSAVLPGTYTVSQMSSAFAAANPARYAFVTDLGGGPDMVLSDGTNWKHIRPGVVTNVVVATSVTLTPLASPPIVQLTGSALTSAGNINISTTNLYPGYTVHIIVPSAVLSTTAGLVGSLGVSVGGGAALPLVGGTWEDVQWNGSTLVELGKGTL